MPKSILLIALLLVVAFSTEVTARNYPTLGTGVWKMRITNPADSGANLGYRIYFNPNRDPWTGDMFFVGSNGTSSTQPDEQSRFKPGQSTDWIDIGEYMSTTPTFYSSLKDYLSTVFIGAIGLAADKPLKLKVELVRTPQQQMSRTVEINEPKPVKMAYDVWFASGDKLPTLGLMLPVREDCAYPVMTLEEVAKQQVDWLEPFGEPRPLKYIWFISHQRSVDLQQLSTLDQMQAKIVHMLGYHNLTNYVSNKSQLDFLKSKDYSTQPAKLVHRGDKPEETAQRLKEAGVIDLVRLINFGDEIDISLTATPAEQDKAFVAYLKKKGFRPMDFVLPENEAAAANLPEDQQWNQVHLGGKLSSTKPKLLYEAAVFRYELWTKELASDTLLYRKLYGNDVDTGANYSPHKSVWPDVRKWVNVFKGKGMTMPWSEDWWWQVPEVSPQTCGIILATLRHSADYYKNPACFYTITDPGPSAEYLLRMNYFALGNQMKVIDHFMVCTQAFGTCDYIAYDESKAKLQAIRQITDAVSKIDKRLYFARMRKAQTAIVLNKANDVWNTENLLEQDQANLYWADLNVDNEERIATWLALRHANIPVDIITDDDIADGALKGYKVAYLAGHELAEKSVPALGAWVRSGGTLVASGGGGLLNEHREPNLKMQQLCGVKAESLFKLNRSVAITEDLPGMKALDTVQAGYLALPVLLYKQSLTPGNSASVIANFSDGAPAALMNKSGKGRVVMLGFLPGLAYLQPAAAMKKEIAEYYPGSVRDFIVQWAQAAQVDKHVITSNPLVDATLQENKQGAVVTLVNFSTKPIKNLHVYLPGLKNAKRIVSVNSGELTFDKTALGPHFTMQLDAGDFLTVD